MSGNRSDLDARLLSAHARGDKSALVALYTEAGAGAEAAGDIDAACFYYTHAYVFALETGDRSARDLCARLKTYGREADPITGTGRAFGTT